MTLKELQRGRPRRDPRADTGASTVDQGATVLVVEDEPSIADVLAIALRYHRFEVMTAGTVRQALTLAERTRPDAGAARRDAAGRRRAGAGR